MCIRIFTQVFHIEEVELRIQTSANERKNVKIEGEHVNNDEFEETSGLFGPTTTSSNQHPLLDDTSSQQKQQEELDVENSKLLSDLLDSIKNLTKSFDQSLHRDVDIDAGEGCKVDGTNGRDNTAVDRSQQLSPPYFPTSTAEPVQSLPTTIACEERRSVRDSVRRAAAVVSAQPSSPAVSTNKALPPRAPLPSSSSSTLMSRSFSTHSTAHNAAGGNSQSFVQRAVVNLLNALPPPLTSALEEAAASVSGSGGRRVFPSGNAATSSSDHSSQQQQRASRDGSKARFYHHEDKMVGERLARRRERMQSRERPVATNDDARLSSMHQSPQQQRLEAAMETQRDKEKRAKGIAASSNDSENIASIIAVEIKPTMRRSSSIGSEFVWN